jgi:hypothetical protein
MDARCFFPSNVSSSTKIPFTALDPQGWTFHPRSLHSIRSLLVVFVFSILYLSSILRVFVLCHIYVQYAFPPNAKKASLFCFQGLFTVLARFFFPLWDAMIIFSPVLSKCRILVIFVDAIYSENFPILVFRGSHRVL